MFWAETTLWDHRSGDISAGPDVVCSLAGRLSGHSGSKRAGGGADEAS